MCVVIDVFGYFYVLQFPCSCDNVNVHITSCAHYTRAWVSPFSLKQLDYAIQITRLHVLAGLLRSNVLFSILHITFALLAHHNHHHFKTKGISSFQCGIILLQYDNTTSIDENERRKNKTDNEITFGLDNGQMLLLLSLALCTTE